MVIWSAEITCKLGSLSWVTLRNFKIANLLGGKQKDRISLTPVEHVLLIFLHRMWVLELCASRWSNLTIASDSSALYSWSKYSALFWGGDISILLLNESGSKGGNVTVAISITLSHSMGFTNILEILKWFLHISVTLTGLFEPLCHCISSELCRSYDPHLSEAPPSFSIHPKTKSEWYMMTPVGVLTYI